MKYMILLIILAMLWIVPIIDSANEPCMMSDDCPQGYCEAGQCVIPNVTNYIITGNCEVTANCTYGYCKDGECILPVAGLEKNYFGLKSGCAGVIDCKTGVMCFLLCNFIWVLLIILAILSGYSTRHYKNKAVPISLVVIPILIALLSIPIAGLVEAIIQLGYISYMKKAKTVNENEEEYSDSQTSR
ncbi:hypothetical protein J7J26_02735 [Candidatus Micrarchaeota archaeon]|nr:hypothetical protein [Candidatus Micrarchaeota archaeon]